MRYVYLSPHLDDAVLSAGGLIYEQRHSGHAVEIWTFMSGFPNDSDLTEFARSLHREWGTSSAEQTVRVRRAEDERAAAAVGAQVRHFDFLDCIYRRGVNGQALYHDIYVPPNPAEQDLPAQIAQTMLAWLKPEDQMICQLGVGGHVDHVIVRKAAEMLERPLLYDADVPYVLNHPEQLDEKSAGLRGVLRPVTEKGLAVWLKAIDEYHSQLKMLFETPAAMQRKMKAFWSEKKGIYLWGSPRQI